MQILVPSFEIDADAAGAADALAIFQAAVGDLFAATPIVADGGASETGAGAMTARAWHLGTIMIGCFSGPALAFERDPALVARSGLDHMLVQLYIDGGFTGTAGAATIDVAAGDICVFDLSDTLATRATAFSNISLLIPREAFSPGLTDLHGLHGLVMRSDEALGAVLADYLRALSRRLPAIEARDALFAAQATASLVGTVLAGEVHKRAGERSAAHPDSPLRRACAYIDAHIADPGLDAPQLMRALGLSRAGLYRLFAQSGGVGRYIRRRRLTGAALDLADPRQKLRVSEVARRWGFASDAGFARCFRQAFGIPPRDARERGIALIADQPADGPVDARGFAYWMRTLHVSGPDT